MKVDKRAGLIVMAAILGVAVSVLLTCHSGPTDWTAFNKNTIEQNLAAIDSASSIYKAQFAAGNTDAAAQQACAFLLTQPGVDSAAIAPDSTVWAYFASGLLAGLGDDMEGADTTSDESAPPPRVSAQTDSGGELDGHAQYILPYTVGLPGTKQAADDIQNILLTKLGWDTCDVYIGDQVTIDLVKGKIANGAGLFFWAGHGILVGRDSVPGLELTDQYDRQAAAEQAVTTCAGYLNPGPNQPRLAGVFHNDINGRFHIVILPAFIKKYGNFDKGENIPGYNWGKTIVYLACCFSAYGNGSSRALFKAFRDVGADLVCGYDWAVEDGFSQNKDEAFFRAMADTCLPKQALRLMGDLTDPTGLLGRHAAFQMDGDTLVLLDAFVQCQVEGTTLRSYGDPEVVLDGSGSVVTGGLYAKPSDANPVAGFTMKFPGKVPGTFNCATEDNAIIYYLDNASVADYYVSKGCQGASGTIDITRCANSILIGTFTGVLGHWGTDQDPTKDPPQSVVHIDNGVVKYTGKVAPAK